MEEEEEASRTVMEEEEENFRTVNVEKSIGLIWRHLMTPLMRQTKEEDLILAGEEMKITGEDKVLAEEEGALTTVKELGGDAKSLHTMEVAEVQRQEGLEAAVVTRCRPQAKRLWLPVTQRPGRVTGRVLTQAVAITTSPGGPSVRGVALPSQGRTTPTPLPTYLR